MSTNKPVPTTVKFSPELVAKIDKAAAITGLPKQEVIRICVAVGLADLERIGFDIAGSSSRSAQEAAKPHLVAADAPDTQPLHVSKAVRYEPKRRAK